MVLSWRAFSLEAIFQPLPKTTRARSGPDFGETRRQSARHLHMCATNPIPAPVRLELRMERNIDGYPRTDCVAERDARSRFLGHAFESVARFAARRPTRWAVAAKRVLPRARARLSSGSLAALCSQRPLPFVFGYSRIALGIGGGFGTFIVAATPLTANRSSVRRSAGQAGWRSRTAAYADATSQRTIRLMRDRGNHCAELLCQGRDRKHDFLQNAARHKPAHILGTNAPKTCSRHLRLAHEPIGPATWATV
jgi:hypothetical protein